MNSGERVICLLSRTFAVPSAFGIISRCFNPRLAAYAASASFISIPTILLLVRKVRKVITWSLSVLIDSRKMDHRVDGLCYRRESELASRSGIFHHNYRVGNSTSRRTNLPEVFHLPSSIPLPVR